MTPYERVMARSRVEDRGYGTSCRVFTNALHSQGYGRIWCGVRSDGKDDFKYAHVIAYEHFYGPVPDGLTIDHLCRQRDCHEHTHLEAVTNLENVRRGIGADVARARHAAQTHCKRGHEFTPENTVRMRQSSGASARGCRTCRAALKRGYRAARKASA